MFASQLIYTGCGKDKTGAFSVWSKTLDISKIEENEIRDKMLYKRQSNLPYEPTQEELDTLFPKKIAYFNLSSGKVCLAQSVYIGKVYSDFDPRPGNYIIHAFVFNKDEDIIPMNYIESAVFKTSLTYQEWHEQDAPDELPKIEIVDKLGALTKQDVDSFFNEERITNLKLLLQAVINSLSSEQKVTFYDDHSKLKYWYKAISLCLPKSLQKELTFSTCFTPSYSFATQNQGVDTEVRIRNISPSVASTIFNYQQDVRSGKYSFDFESNIIPTNIEISSYVQNVVDLLKTNIFNAIMLVDSVGIIKEKCGVDFDTALDIHYVLNKQIDKVDDIDKLNSLIKYVSDYYNETIRDVADYLYEYGFKSGRWELSSSISNIYRFVFNYSTIVDKGQMICQFIRNQSLFGVDINANETEYCISFKNNAPFSWSNFLDFIFTADNLAEYLKINSSPFNSRYLIFDAFVEIMSQISESQEKKNIVLRYFVDTAKYYIQSEKLNEMLSLIKCIGKCGSKWQVWLVEKPYSLMCNEGRRLSDVCSYRFTLLLLEACAETTLASKLISQLIRENEKNNEFIKVYVECYDHNTQFYTSVFKEIANDERYADFITSIELYRFAVSKIVTKKQLQDYYDNYFIVGKDANGIFPRKLKQYLSNYKEKDCIIESLSCYSLWIKEKELNTNVLNACVLAICEAFFAVSKEALKDYVAVRGTQKIKEMLTVVSGTYRAPNHYYVIAFGENLKRLVEEIKHNKKSPYIEDTFKRLKEDAFYRIPKDDDSREMLVELYLPNLFQLYLVLKTEDNFEEIYNQIFKPICIVDGFEKGFLEQLNKLNEKEFDSFFGNTLVCACARSNKFNDYLMQLVETKLEDMGRKQRKRFFAQLLNSVSRQNEKKVKAYIDQYQKEHESFFDRLFGAFGKKNDGDTPKKQEKGKK